MVKHYEGGLTLYGETHIAGAFNALHAQEISAGGQAGERNFEANTRLNVVPGAHRNAEGIDDLHAAAGHYAGIGRQVEVVACRVGPYH